MLRATLILILLATCAVATDSFGQQIGTMYGFQSQNSQNNGYFGRVIISIDDADGDGIRDMLIGAPDEQGNSGRVHLHSGATGAHLWTFEPTPATAGLSVGRAIASPGDINDDGRPDFLIAGNYPVNGLENAGMVHLVDGATGAVLLSLSSPQPQEDGFFGFNVAAPGDLNGDGTQDYVVGTGDEDVEIDGELLVDHGAIYAFSGEDGSVLWRTTAPGQGAEVYFGRVVVAGDLNGDGVNDLLGSAIRAVDENGLPSGLAYAIDGSDGSILYTMSSEVNAQDNGWFGFSMAGLPDIDGDGVPDIIIGAPYEGVMGSVRDGTVSFFSGADGSFIGTYIEEERQENRYYGWQVKSLGDLNGDGITEIGISALRQFNSYGYRPPPYSRPFSGALFVANGADVGQSNVEDLIELYPNLPNLPTNFNYNFGYDFASLGDVDGDGIPDIVVGLPTQGANIGNIRGYSGAALMAISNETEDARSEQELSDAGVYEFEDTAVDLVVDGGPAKNGSSTDLNEPIQVIVKRHTDPPRLPEGVDAANVSHYRWMVLARGQLRLPEGSEIRFRLDEIPNSGIIDPADVAVYYRSTYASGSFERLETRYDADARQLIASGFSTTGEFIFGSNSSPLPAEPELHPLPTALTVYPNPASSSASLSLTLAEAATEARIELFDMLGRRATVLHHGPMAAGSHSVQVDIADLAQGAYLMRVALPQQTLTQSVIIAR